MPKRSRRVAELVAMAAAYYIAGRLGLLFAIPAGYAPAVWPAAGIALAGVLLFGSRIWPGIFLGSFLIRALTSVDTTSAASLLNTAFPAVSIGIGASLQAVVGAFLIHRFVQSPGVFVEARDIIKFLFLGGPVSCLVSATWGLTSLVWVGAIQGDEYLFRWWTWWVGDSIGVITFTPLVLIWAARPLADSLRRKISVSVPLILAFTLVAAFFVFTNTWERDLAKLEFERRTDRVTHQLKENFDNDIDVLRSLEAFYASSVRVRRQDFHTFVARWLSQHPGIRTLSWNPRVPDSERATYEQAARQDGLNNFQILEQGPQGQLIRAGRRAEYFPVYYFESRGGIKRSLGFDVAFDPVRREALDRARDTGKPAASDRITLIKDTLGEPSFLVFLPIYRSRAEDDVAERRRNLQGYVSGAFRVREIINNALTSADLKDINIRLLDGGSQGEKRPWYEDRSQETMLNDGSINGHPESGGALKRSISFEFAERRWIFEFSPTRGYLITQRRWQAWGVLAGGLLFPGLLGSFLLAVTGHASKLQAMNAELHKEIVQRETSQTELTKFAVIVDSLDEAIIGSTWGGNIITWNKGAEIIYGYSAEEVTGRSISFLYPPDRPDELPRLRQKLEQGERIAQYETVRVRKDGTHVPISLTLSPMKDPAGKIVGIASIASDITVRKRSEAALQQHREAVAHRLHDSVLQSLTAIGMHLEMARNLLRLHPELAWQHLAKIESVLSDEQKNLRLFVRELKEVRLAAPVDDTSAMAVMEKLVKRLENQWSIRIELEAEQGLSWMPTQIVEDLLYIIQEGVSNAVCHGHASTVQIQIGQKEEMLIMRIMDDGGGFPLEYDQVGLPAMLRSRIATLGGSLTIRTADSGACLEIILPLLRPGASHANHPRSSG